jgi:NAD(P)-dependent dehydrogenase (short-subunit alcohol dehydrogenase family)
MNQANEHQGRVAVITGGNGGIGGAIAKRLVSEGALVHVLDVNDVPRPKQTL